MVYCNIYTVDVYRFKGISYRFYSFLPININSVHFCIVIYTSNTCNYYTFYVRPIFHCICLQYIIFFFIKSCKIICKNPSNLFFYYECPKPIRNYEKNIWNVRFLVSQSFVPSAQQTMVLYCRLSDFWPHCPLGPTGQVK